MGHTRRTSSPVSLDLLCDALEQGVSYKRWHVVVWSCAMAGELIYVAFSDPKRTKGVYRLPKSRWGTREGEHEGLCRLRNTCFHPGFIVRMRKGETGIDELASIIKHGDSYLADALRRDWLMLYERHVAAWAIRQLDAAGQRTSSSRPQNQVRTDVSALVRFHAAVARLDFAGDAQRDRATGTE